MQLETLLEIYSAFLFIISATDWVNGGWLEDSKSNSTKY
jgi:hypothetical protein